MITGRCLCGATTYTVSSVDDQIGVCHCDDCQRWSGGPFLGVDVTDLEFQGAVRWFATSDWAERASCSVCGSAMAWRLKDGRNPTVTAGSLTDRSLIKGTKMHIFSDSRPDYYDLAGDAKRLTGEETMAYFMAQMQAEDA